MSLGQYVRVSPSPGNTPPHHPYSHIIHTHSHTDTHIYTPAAFSVSWVDASIWELASVLCIFQRLLSWADCVAAASCYNQLLYNGVKWKVKCTWLVLCSFSLTNAWKRNYDNVASRRQCGLIKCTQKRQGRIKWWTGWMHVFVHAKWTCVLSCDHKV